MAEEKKNQKSKANISLIIFCILVGLLGLAVLSYFFGNPFKEYIVSLLYSVVSPVISMYYLVKVLPVLGFVELAAYFVIAVLYLTGRNRFHHPTVRMFYNLLISSLPLYGIIIRIMLVPKIADLVEFPVFFAILISIVLYAILIFFIIDKKETFFFVVPKFSIVLYLRRFLCDHHGVVDVDVENYFGTKQLLRIGDPRTEDGGNVDFKGSTYFLPMKKWKPIVEYYMYRSQWIICKIGVSDGLIWEMFEHDDLQGKIIYALDYDCDLKEVLDVYHERGYSGSALYHSLKQLTCRTDRPLYLALVDGDHVSSVDLAEVVDKLNNQEAKSKRKGKKNNLLYLIGDCVRYLSMLIRPRVANTSLIYSILIVIKIIEYAMGVFLMYYGCLTLLSVFIPAIDGSVFDFADCLKGLDRAPVGRLLLASLSGGFGRILMGR